MAIKFTNIFFATLLIVMTSHIFALYSPEPKSSLAKPKTNVECSVHPKNPECKGE